jgi:regulatory protein
LKKDNQFFMKKARRPSPRSLSFEEVYAKACRYCAYQERSPAEVEQFLKDKFMLSEVERRRCIDHLIEDGFLNKRRFAMLYTQSKFRQKQWGKQKIAFHLKQKAIDDQLIEEALDALDPIEYEACLQKLLQQKNESLQKTESDPLKQRAKLIRYAQQKGYESDLIYKLMQALGN